MQEKDKDKNKDPFLSVIKEKLENHAIEPDNSVWDEIETRLNSKKKINLAPWISVAAAAACIVLLWLTIPFNNQINRDHEDKQLSQNEPPTTQDIPEAADVEPTGYPVQENRLIASVEKKQSENSIRVASGIGNEITQPAQAETQEQGQETVSPPPRPKAEPETKEESSQGEKKRLSQEEAEQLLYAMIAQKQEPLLTKSKKQRVSLGLSIGSGNNYVADNNNPLLSDGNWDLKAVGSPLQKSPSDAINEEILTYKDFEEVSHNAPLSFGLSMRFPLNERFAIETGVSYTYLSSSFKNKSPKRDASLRLHYLGIPVNAVVNIYEADNWRFYASVGVMAEKGIYSYYAQREYDDLDNKRKTVSPDTKIPGMQLSAHLSPGAEFRFDKNYSIYIEPKLGYYFDNNQPVSIRTEHPLNVGITAGLRFSL